MIIDCERKYYQLSNLKDKQNLNTFVPIDEVKGKIINSSGLQVLEFL